MATLDSLLRAGYKIATSGDGIQLGNAPEAEDIHAIVTGMMDQDRKRKLAEQLQMDHLTELARGEVRREHAARLQAGGVPGIPIPDVPVPEDGSSELQEIIANIHNGDLPGRRPINAAGIGMPIPQGQVAGGALQHGGRSFGPDLGIMGASPIGNSPSERGSAGPYRFTGGGPFFPEGESPEVAYLRSQGFIEHPFRTDPNMPGVGIPKTGQFFEVPKNMRSSETAMDVIRRVQQEHPDQGFPRQTNPHVFNRAQEKQLGRDGIPAGAAHMLARTDDGGQMGRFAQAAISPQGAAAMGQADARLAQSQLATREQDFKDRALLPTLLANMTSNMQNPTPQAVMGLAKIVSSMVPQGGGVPQSVLSGLPGMGNPSAIGAPMITATTPEEALSALMRAGDMDDAQLKAAYDQVANILTPAAIESAISENSVGWMGDALGYPHNTNQMVPILKGIDTVLGTEFQETPAEYDVRDQKYRMLNRLRRVAAGL